MNWKNVSTFLFFALLFVLISSAISPVISLQKSMSISSSGTVNYSGLPTPTPTPTPIRKGEVFLWVGFWLVDGSGQPNSAAQRIVAAKNAYGNPTWVEAGNWGGGGAGTVAPQMTSTLINYLHGAGIKVSCRIWAAGAGRHPKVSIYDLCHSMDPNYPYGGSVDYQLSIGPEIDMIMLDEACLNSVSELQELANYVHSKGKLFAANWGGSNFPEELCNIADIISVEGHWVYFINNRQDLIAQYPNKFMAISNDVTNQYFEHFHPTVTLETAVADTSEAWNGGIYYFESRSGASETNPPSWWEQYLSSLPQI